MEHCLILFERNLLTKIKGQNDARIVFRSRDNLDEFRKWIDVVNYLKRYIVNARRK